MKKIIYKNASKIASAMFAVLAGTGTEIFFGDDRFCFRIGITILIVILCILLYPLLLIGDNFLLEYNGLLKSNDDDPFTHAYNNLNNENFYEIVGLKPKYWMKIILYGYISIITIGVFLYISNQKSVETQQNKIIDSIQAQDSIISIFRQKVDSELNIIINKINEQSSFDSIQNNKIDTVIQQNSKIIDNWNKQKNK